MDQIAPARSLVSACSDQGLQIAVDRHGWTVRHRGRSCTGAPAVHPALLAVAAVGLGLVVGLDAAADDAMRALDALDPALLGAAYAPVLAALAIGLTPA